MPFVLDYYPDWVASLRLPPSDGSHSHLRTEEFHSVLDRLEPIPDVAAPLQLFSAVDIGHKDWLGVQTVHAVPFQRTKARMVNSTTFVYVCINMYMYVNACICMYTNVYVVILMYMYVYVCICMYMLDDVLTCGSCCLILSQDYVMFIPPPPHYRGSPSDYSPPINDCWYGHVNLILKMRVRTDSGRLMECKCALIETMFNNCPT